MSFQDCSAGGGTRLLETHLGSSNKDRRQMCVEQSPENQLVTAMPNGIAGAFRPAFPPKGESEPPRFYRGLFSSSYATLSTAFMFA